MTRPFQVWLETRLTTDPRSHRQPAGVGFPVAGMPHTSLRAAYWMARPNIRRGLHSRLLRRTPIPEWASLHWFVKSRYVLRRTVWTRLRSGKWASVDHKPPRDFLCHRGEHHHGLGVVPEAVPSRGYGPVYRRRHDSREPQGGRESSNPGFSPGVAVSRLVSRRRAPGRG